MFHARCRRNKGTKFIFWENIVPKRNVFMLLVSYSIAIDPGVEFGVRTICGRSFDHQAGRARTGILCNLIRTLKNMKIKKVSIFPWLWMGEIGKLAEEAGKRSLSYLIMSLLDFCFLVCDQIVSGLLRVMKFIFFKHSSIHLYCYFSSRLSLRLWQPS